jgi:GGDEF domain-containing protein
MADKLEPTQHLYAEDELRHLLEREVKRSTRYQDFLSVCLIRIESTDPSSGAVRDAIARQVADMLRSADLVGSIGEDIAVLLVHTPDTDAVMIANRIRDRIDLPSGPGQPGVAFRIGLASFPVDATSHGALLAHAQARLEATS